jgi:hypothetical protein
MSTSAPQVVRRGAIAVACAGAIALIGPTVARGGALDTLGSRAAGVEAIEPFTALLSGANEVPGPGDPDGTGAAAITIDRATGEICFDLRAEGIRTATPASAAHIHRGAAGAAGVIEVTLAPPAPSSSGCVTAPPTLAAEIADHPAGFYVNVHNSDHPDGALRGQLAAPTAFSGSTQVLAEPVRVYDSREGTDGPIVAGETRIVGLGAGVDAMGRTVLAVPPGATAAMVRLTVTDAVGAGFLQLYSNALTVPPATSAANWYESGSIVGADATVAIDAEAKVKVTAGVNRTHLVIDVVGYVF